MRETLVILDSILSPPALHDPSLIFSNVFFCTQNYWFKFVDLHAAHLQLVVSASNLVCDVGIKTVELVQGRCIFFISLT